MSINCTLKKLLSLMVVATQTSKQQAIIHLFNYGDGQLGTEDKDGRRLSKDPPRMEEANWKCAILFLYDKCCYVSQLLY